MTTEITPFLKVILIDLLSRGGTVLQKHFKPPEYETNRKLELIHLGLISERKVPQTKGNLVTEISLTDKGWAYLNDNLDFPLNSGSKSVKVIFGRLLRQLSVKLHSKDLTIDKLFDSKTSPKPPKPPKAPLSTSEELLRHIQKIYREQKSLVMPGGGLRIAKLWSTLEGLSLEKLRELLFDLQKKEHLVIYRFDDPGMLEPEDKKAEIRIGGEPRHYIFLKSYI